MPENSTVEEMFEVVESTIRHNMREKCSKILAQFSSNVRRDGDEWRVAEHIIAENERFRIMMRGIRTAKTICRRA